MAHECRQSRMLQWQDARYPVLPALAFVIMLGGMAWAAGRLFGFDWSADQVERQIEAWGSWAALASVGLMVLHSFVPFPAEILAFANGMIFGPLWGRRDAGRFSGFRHGTAARATFCRNADDGAPLSCPRDLD